LLLSRTNSCTYNIQQHSVSYLLASQMSSIIYLINKNVS